MISSLRQSFLISHTLIFWNAAPHLRWETLFHLRFYFVSMFWVKHCVLGLLGTGVKGSVFGGLGAGFYFRVIFSKEKTGRKWDKLNGILSNGHLPISKVV